MIESIIDLFGVSFRQQLTRKPNWTREEILDAFAQAKRETLESITTSRSALLELMSENDRDPA